MRRTYVPLSKLHGTPLTSRHKVLLEFKTGQHFVFPEGGGNAIITALMGHIMQYQNCDVLWNTEARHLLTTRQGAIDGVQVRKRDGLLYDL